MGYLKTVDDLLIYIFGKYCFRCKAWTQPYIGENGEFPCCDGCWKEYPK